MPRQRKGIVYMATSADGYIARPDGSVEWLNRRPHKYDYGMKQFYASMDTILLGRKTYDWAVNYYKKDRQAAAVRYEGAAPRLLAEAGAKSCPRSRVRDEARQDVHAEAASAARQAHLDEWAAAN